MASRSTRPPDSKYFQGDDYPPSPPWKELQLHQNEKFIPVLQEMRVEKLAKYYELVVGDIDWELEGSCRCRVKGAPCYGREHKNLAKVKIHLDSERHRVSFEHKEFARKKL